MKTKLITFLGLMCLLFASCSDDDDDYDSSWVPGNVMEAFKADFTNVVHPNKVEWERKIVYDTKYIVAEFWADRNGKNYETDACYDEALAKLKLTKTEIDKRNHINDPLVTKAVKDAFTASEYSANGWRIDDIEMLEQPGLETIYMIEVEKKGMGDVHLFYTASGEAVSGLNGGGSVEVSNETKSKFEQDFKGKIVGPVKWKNKGSYKVAEFDTMIDNRRYEIEAWYDNQGNWFMTETELKSENINDPLVPAAVRDAFNATAYKTWKIDDLDMIERAGLEKETTFMIEVKKAGQADVKLLFSKDGYLLQEIAEQGSNGGNHEWLIPSKLPEKVKSFLDQKYAGYRLMDVDIEKGAYLEVEIIHENKKKEAFFKLTSNEWEATKWELRTQAELPTAVKNTIKSSEYAQWAIDDMDYIEMPQGIFYEVEFEKKGQPDVKVRYTADGKVVK